MSISKKRIIYLSFAVLLVSLSATLAMDPSEDERFNKEKIKLNYSSHAKELEEEFTKRKKIFSVREEMIEECINQYRVLKSSTVTYRQFYEVYLKLYPLCVRRLKFNKENNIIDEDMRYTWLMIKEAGWILCALYWIPKIILPDEDCKKGNEDFWDLIYDLEADVREGLRLYEELYHCPHPRKDEFYGALCESWSLFL